MSDSPATLYLKDVDAQARDLKKLADRALASAAFNEKMAGKTGS